ncbi:hypothetical protein ACIHAR_02650 [Streptomyces sp. NPDC052016]
MLDEPPCVQLLHGRGDAVGEELGVLYPHLLRPPRHVVHPGEGAQEPL